MSPRSPLSPTRRGEAVAGHFYAWRIGRRGWRAVRSDLERRAQFARVSTVTDTRGRSQPASGGVGRSRPSRRAPPRSNWNCLSAIRRSRNYSAALDFSPNVAATSPFVFASEAHSGYVLFRHARPANGGSTRCGRQEQLGDKSPNQAPNRFIKNRNSRH
jgi:hypothetical protein